MRFAIDIPNFGPFADPRLVADVARDAEAAGWDAVWVWDHVHRDVGVPYADPWVLLAAIALATERVRLGPMVTPLPRRRPWNVARQATTLDGLSGGRLTLGIGLGSPLKEYTAFGEDADAKIRAEKLDEGLAILAGLWTGKPFSFDGRHYHVEDVLFLPEPVQQPRIPIWLAATWPVRAPFRRAARWDGVWPIMRTPDGEGISLRPEDARAVREAVAELRAGVDEAPFDVQIDGATPGDDPVAARETVAAFEEAGATWWTERINESRGDLDAQRLRIRQGPPRG